MPGFLCDIIYNENQSYGLTLKNLNEIFQINYSSYTALFPDK
jgi:hypothetical protein